MNERLYMVGKVVNTHGIRGELKILSHTDFPETRFKQGSELLLALPGQSELLHLKVERARAQKNVYIVKFSGLNDINEAIKYKGGELKVTKEHLVELSEDEYYFHEIIGCLVVTDVGEELGTITEILTPGANDVWVVSRPQGGNPVLIPVIDDVLLHVDIPLKRVTIHLMEGLI